MIKCTLGRDGYDIIEYPVTCNFLSEIKKYRDIAEKKILWEHLNEEI